MSIDNHHHHQYLHQHPANIFVATTTNSASIGCSSISSSSGGSNSNSMSKAAVTAATVAVAEGTGTNSSTTSTSTTSTSTALTAQQVLTDLLAKIKDVDLADLVPPSVRFELDQLELELLEGRSHNRKFHIFRFLIVFLRLIYSYNYHKHYVLFLL